MNIAIIIDKEDKKIISNLTDYKNLEPTEVNTSGFDGSENLTLLLSLSAATITGIAQIIITLLKNRRFVKIHFNGKVIEGIKESDTLIILEKLLQAEEKSQNNKEDKEGAE